MPNGLMEPKAMLKKSLKLQDVNCEVGRCKVSKLVHRLYIKRQLPTLAKKLRRRRATGKFTKLYFVGMVKTMDSIRLYFSCKFGLAQNKNI